jgi:hypothetical protein
MPGKYSKLMGSRRATIGLFSAFCFLLLVVLVIGLDNAAGIICGNLAVAMLYIVMTRRWWKIRSFVILFFVSMLSVIILSGLYVEVILRLSMWIGGEGATENTAFRFVHFLVTNFMLLACPSGMLVGIIGASALGIIRLSSLGTKKSASGT